MQPKPIILMVEDHQAVGSGKKDLLEDRGYFVIWYWDGREAYEAISGGLSYHVGFFDLSLPEVGGDELTRLSKQVNPRVPIICTSSYGILAKMAPGADRYLERPVSISKLDEVIRGLLGCRD